MITQEEYQHCREVKGKLIEHWLSGVMGGEELRFQIEDNWQKRIVDDLMPVYALGNEKPVAWVRMA